MELVTNILLCVILGLLASSILVFWLFVRRLRDAIVDFVTPPAEDKPSQLAIAVDAGAVLVGRAITAQIKTTLMGQVSGEVRAEKAIQGAMAMDNVEGAGMSGLLNALGPNMRRTLRRNPSLVDLALPFLQGVLQKGGNNHSTPVSSGSPKFRL